jgi:monolysocardiolipin acyltransferase
MSECIRLLSAGPFTTPTAPHPAWKTIAKPSVPFTESPPTAFTSSALTDPFSDPSASVYSTTGTDAFPSPSFYASRRFSWVHIFPEGRVHQHPQHGLRYFKWGVARLILESEPCPDVVPVFIEGMADVMNEERGPPRWMPRLGKAVGITFGDRVGEEVFGAFRERWKRLKEKAGVVDDVVGGELVEELRTGMEAESLRMEVALKVRELVAALRRKRGYPDEDPKTGYFETYRIEGPKKTGRMDDDSVVGRT